MPLPAVANATGAPIAQCANFVSGSTWGAVRAADVKMAGEVASNIPIEIIGDAAAAYAAVLTGCRSQGTDIGSVAALAANGIIGVGLLAQNCGVYCAQVGSRRSRIFRLPFDWLCFDCGAD
jgi:hypothetical protein